MVVVQLEPQELKDHNLHILKLRKKEYKRSLTKHFEFLGYVFIIILYFQNVSFIRFAVRMIMHKVLGSPFPSQAEMQLEDNVKRQLRKSFLTSMIAINIIFLLLDLSIGVPSDNPDSEFFNGSLTLQIIGETKPSSRLVYIYYNVAIFVSQFMTLYCSTVLDTNADIEKQNTVLPDSTYTLNEVEGDGYTGRANVATIHPLEIAKEISSFAFSTESTDHYNDYMGNRLNLGSMLNG